jgi:small subunit ribosomal protein S16
MLRMRLRRVGKMKQPSYRVVVADQHAKRDGDFVEVVGHYNPRNKPNVIDFKEDRVRHWLAVGAQPSETVQRLLFANGLTTVEPAKRVTKAAADAAAAAAAEKAAAEKAAADAAEAARTTAAAEAELQNAGAEAEFTEE